MDEPKLKLIGIAGTNGSGKDTLGHILAQNYNYLFVSVTELLRAECHRRDIVADRENLRMVSAEWRRESGLGVLVDKALAEYKSSKTSYEGLAIASLRNPGEVDRVHELKGSVVWLDADPRVRYARVQAGAYFRTHRLHEDNKTFDEFMAEEYAEMHASGDSATLDMSAVKQKADLIIDNSDENAKVFAEQIANLLKP